MITIPKTFVKRILVCGFIPFLYLMLIQGYLKYPVGQAKEKDKTAMESRENEPECWLSQWRSDIEQSQLYLYAVKLFKEPLDYEGKITDTFEDKKFGTILFTFSGGAKLMIETYPPESSRVTLRVPDGFPDEREACYALEQYVRRTGINLEWSKSKLQKQGAERIVNFHPFDPELNATAFQVYKNEKLIEIGFSMAL